MKSQINPNFQKKIKDYVISYSPSELYGKNIHGEMRSGFISAENKVVIFRIVPLPLTPSSNVFLQLQHHYSGLSGFARIVHEPLHSSSNHYVPLQYFPKTFHSQRKTFKNNPKYMDQYIQKFLKVYSFFYNMRVTHGNLTEQNIGITFDGKIKLMDFVPSRDNQSFEERAKKDFYDFKFLIGSILQKDDNFPAKFITFNNENNHNWRHLFSQWHIISPLQPLYISRTHYIDNIVTLLFKLFNSLEENDLSVNLRMATRLLMLNYLMKSKEEEHERELQSLQEITGKLSHWNCEKMNGVLMGAIKDASYYQINPEQRLLLICCLIPQLNHEYVYYQIIHEFTNEQTRRNELLGDSLYITYKYDIFNNLLQEKY